MVISRWRSSNEQGVPNRREPEFWTFHHINSIFSKTVKGTKKYTPFWIHNKRAKRTLWMKIVPGVQLTLIKRHDVKISEKKSGPRDACDITAPKRCICHGTSFRWLLKRIKLRIWNILGIQIIFIGSQDMIFRNWLKKSKTCSKIGFLFFRNRKIIFPDSCSWQFLKGLSKSILCKNFKPVAQTA